MCILFSSCGNNEGNNTNISDTNLDIGTTSGIDENNNENNNNNTENNEENTENNNITQEDSNRYVLYNQYEMDDKFSYIVSESNPLLIRDYVTRFGPSSFAIEELECNWRFSLISIDENEDNLDILFKIENTEVGAYSYNLVGYIDQVYLMNCYLDYKANFDIESGGSEDIHIYVDKKFLSINDIKTLHKIEFHISLEDGRDKNPIIEETVTLYPTGIDDFDSIYKELHDSYTEVFNNSGYSISISNVNLVENTYQFDMIVKNMWNEDAEIIIDDILINNDRFEKTYSFNLGRNKTKFEHVSFDLSKLIEQKEKILYSITFKVRVIDNTVTEDETEGENSIIYNGDAVYNIYYVIN